MNIKEELGREIEEAKPLMEEIIDALIEFERKIIEHDRIRRTLIKLFEHVLNMAKKSSKIPIILIKPCKEIGQRMKYLKICENGKVIYGEIRNLLNSDNYSERIEIEYDNGRLITHREVDLEDIEKILEMIKELE